MQAAARSLTRALKASNSVRSAVSIIGSPFGFEFDTIMAWNPMKVHSYFYIPRNKTSKYEKFSCRYGRKVKICRFVNR